MSLTLLPDLGDLYRLHPQYNAGTVTEILSSLGVSEVLWATGNDPDHPLRDALPAAGVQIRDGLTPDWAWADEDHAKLQEFLKLYPQGRERLREVAAAERELAGLLLAPMTPARAVSAELLGAARTHHDRVRDLLDEGPGTHWRARRLDTVAAALEGQSGAVLAPLDDLPGLLDRLPGAALPDLAGVEPGEASRLRALADRAWQLDEDDDLGALLDALSRETGDRVTPRAELDAAGANIYLATGDMERARTLLERAAHALHDDHPRSLAGLTLARLGQVRDALGDRELAQRTYRAVLALSYAPQVARDAAQAGLETPFVIG